MKRVPLVQTQPSFLASQIDHTLLKADATRSDIERLCAEASQFKFIAVCVNPCWVSLACQLLQGSNVKVVAVVGFPLGACLTSVKAFETREAISLGASEIDMVLNIGALKSGDEVFVFEDIRAVVDAAKPHEVKVILETALLTDAEKVKACQIARKAGAAFVKTSTGFSKSGATLEDVRLMRQTVGSSMGVKASGGIRSKKDALAMLEAGANRLGTSASVLICE